MFSNRSGFEKIFLISVLTTLIGILLPWVNGFNGNISGIESFYGVIIFILLLVSLGIFYFTQNKRGLVSISIVVIGILSFLFVLRSFIDLSYGINPITGIYVDYGKGGYITALGSIGIVIAGIVGLKEKK